MPPISFGRKAVLTLKAPAKLNLTLEVLGKRADGYHEVRSVMQAIDLCDLLEFEPMAELRLAVSPAGAVSMDGNLVLKAAFLLQQAVGIRKGAFITLHKRIPIAAGLGGGSSDAAMTLLGLNELWGLELSELELLGLAARLGSDVPFFIKGGTALAAGRGELITPIARTPELWAVTMTPVASHINEAKTARLYGLLTPANFSFRPHHTDDVVRRIKDGAPLDDSLYNTFDHVGKLAYRNHEEHQAEMLEAGASDAHLAGSGPTLFCVASSQQEAQQIAGRLRPDDCVVHVARFLPAWGIEGLRG